MEACNKENQINNFLVMDGKVVSVLFKEGVQRWLYKRNPAGMELHLTDEIFEEAVESSINDTGIWTAETLYREIRDTDEHYARLMRKVYKKYLRETVFGMRIHQDAFWS